METKLLGIGEAATRLGVSKDTIRRLGKAGHVRTVRISRRRMIPETEVERLAEHGVGRYASQPEAPEAAAR